MTFRQPNYYPGGQLVFGSGGGWGGVVCLGGEYYYKRGERYVGI